jgi:hypothetical protein
VIAIGPSRGGPLARSDQPSEEIEGLTERQVDDALLRLESYGLASSRERSETSSYAIYDSPRLTALGHRVLGAWPTSTNSPPSKPCISPWWRSPRLRRRRSAARFVAPWGSSASWAARSCRPRRRGTIGEFGRGSPTWDSANR